MHTPEAGETIEWALLTAAVLHSSEQQACEQVAWDTQRWGIEGFPRTLKRGCRVEDRPLGQGDRLQACLAIDMVMAWRIQPMSQLGREVPELPADLYFDQDAIQMLFAYEVACEVAHEVTYEVRHEVRLRKPPVHEPAPRWRDPIRTIAKHGGFLERQSDGEPGNETLWRALAASRVGADIAWTRQAPIESVPPVGNRGAIAQQ